MDVKFVLCNVQTDATDSFHVSPPDLSTSLLCFGTIDPRAYQTPWERVYPIRLDLTLLLFIYIASSEIFYYLV